jgi:hypothetical protein
VNETQLAIIIALVFFYYSSLGFLFMELFKALVEKIEKEKPPPSPPPQPY